MLVDYHVHGLAHGEFKHVLSDIEPFVRTAAERGVNELGFTEHDRFLSKIDFNLYQQLQQLYPQVTIRIGLEVDYRKGKEEEFARLISSYAYDYVIGSVHEVDDWPFDNKNYIQEYDNWEIDQLYRRYFELVQLMAETKLCQVVGHLDLIKVFGFRPKTDVLSYLPPVLTAIKEANMAVEINTNGWHKPVQEVYPAEAILKECFKYDIPITLSSDSHSPEQVGRDLDKAVLLAKKVGYNKIATFQQKKMIIQPLG